MGCSVRIIEVNKIQLFGLVHLLLACVSNDTTNAQENIGTGREEVNK
jgi:hypothetical protein